MTVVKSKAAESGRTVADFRGIPELSSERILPQPQPKIPDFLSAFFPDQSEPIHLRGFKPRHAPDSPDNRPRKLVTTRAAITNAPASQAELKALNQTLGVYFVVNAGGDTDDSITRFNAWFAESDTATIEDQQGALGGRCTTSGGLSPRFTKSVLLSTTLRFAAFVGRRLRNAT